MNAFLFALQTQIVTAVNAQGLVATDRRHQRTVAVVSHAVDAFGMGIFARGTTLDGNLLKGWSLVEVEFAVLLATGDETKGAVGLEIDGARLAFQVLVQVALCIARVPLNDAGADGLGNVEKREAK